MIMAIFRRTLRAWCLSFLTGLGCVSALGQDFSGLWNNGKDEFGEAALSIRRDGKGVLHAAVWKAPFRWVTNSDGIVLKVMVGADPTNHISMAFAYDRKLGTLIRTNARSEVEVFSRISTNEPPDYEAIAEQKQREQQEAIRRHAQEARDRIKTNIVAHAEELFLQMKSFVEMQSTNRQPRTLAVRSVDKSWQISIEGGSYDMLVSVPLLSLSASNKTVVHPIRRFVEVTNQPPVLPLVYAAPDGTYAKLTNYCRVEKLECIYHVYEEHGTNGVEAFDRIAYVRVDPQPPALEAIKVLKFLLSDIVGVKQTGFEVITR